jgi:hypothetical protein
MKRNLGVCRSRIYVSLSGCVSFHCFLSDCLSVYLSVEMICLVCIKAGDKYPILPEGISADSRISLDGFTLTRESWNIVFTSKYGFALLAPW